MSESIRTFEMLADVAVAAIEADELFPEDLDAVFGIDRSSDSDNKVYQAWHTLIKHGLIEQDELVGALKDKRLKVVFAEKVQTFSVDNKPRWVAMPHLARLVHDDDALLERCHFSSEYDPEKQVQHTRRARSKGVEEEFWAVPQKLKDNGNALFKEKKYKEALKCYTEALQCYGCAPYPKRTWKLISVLYSNASQCHVCTENWGEARRSAKTALGFDPDNEKAKWRKEQAEARLMERLDGIEREARANGAKDFCEQQ